MGDNIKQRLRDAALTGADLSPGDQLAADALRHIELLERWIGDLQSRMYVNCVFCGYRYGPETLAPASILEATSSAAGVLRKHIASCPEHPMRTLTLELERIKSAYLKGVGPAWAEVRNRSDWEHLTGFHELDSALGLLHKEVLHI